MVTILTGVLMWLHSLLQVGPVVVSPLPGDILQGMIIIIGTSEVSGFTNYEVSFTYTGDTTGTWFSIYRSDQAKNNDVLAEWDTALISDGRYDLRLQVFLSDGTVLEDIVPGLVISNYTPTITPIPPEITAAPTPTLDLSTPTTWPASPTPLAPNPAELSDRDVFTSLGVGALAVTALLALLFLYTRVQRK